MLKYLTGCSTPPSGACRLCCYFFLLIVPSALSFTLLYLDLIMESRERDVAAENVFARLQMRVQSLSDALINLFCLLYQVLFLHEFLGSNLSKPTFWVNCSFGYSRSESEGKDRTRL